MKVSKYIKILQELQNEYGDLEVETYSVAGDRQPAREPQSAFHLILRGRQSKPRFWSSWDHQNLQGERVIYV